MLLVRGNAPASGPQLCFAAQRRSHLLPPPACLCTDGTLHFETRQRRRTARLEPPRLRVSQSMATAEATPPPAGGSLSRSKCENCTNRRQRGQRLRCKLAVGSPPSLRSRPVNLVEGCYFVSAKLPGTAGSTWFKRSGSGKGLQRLARLL